MSNMHTVIYSLLPIIQRDRIVHSTNTIRPVPYGLASPADACVWGLRRTLVPPSLTSEFMGMASYALTTFHELLDDEVESDGSSIGDVAPSHCPS